MQLRKAAFSLQTEVMTVTAPTLTTRDAWDRSIEAGLLSYLPTHFAVGRHIKPESMAIGRTTSVKPLKHL